MSRLRLQDLDSTEAELEEARERFDPKNVYNWACKDHGGDNNGWPNGRNECSACIFLEGMKSERLRADALASIKSGQFAQPSVVRYVIALLETMLEQAGRSPNAYEIAEQIGERFGVRRPGT